MPATHSKHCIAWRLVDLAAWCDGSWHSDAVKAAWCPIVQCWVCSGAAFEENKEEIKQGDEYEFTPWEGRILEVVMESMRMAGLALAVRAMATICLGMTWQYCCDVFREDMRLVLHLRARN